LCIINPWRFSKNIDFNSSFSSSLELSFPPQVSKQWRFWIEINNCSSQIGIETSKGFQHLRVRIPASRAGIVKRAKQAGVYLK
jgi:hypothetical protein